MVCSPYVSNASWSISRQNYHANLAKFRIENLESGIQSFKDNPKNKYAAKFTWHCINCYSDAQQCLWKRCLNGWVLLFMKYGWKAFMMVLVPIASCTTEQDIWCRLNFCSTAELPKNRTACLSWLSGYCMWGSCQQFGIWSASMIFSIVSSFFL